MTQYFSCRLAPNGIGDQISQLQRLYNIGKSFGLEYVYREPPRNRWSPDFDAPDFLGLGLGERRIEDFADHAIVSIDGAAASHALFEGRLLASVLPARMPERAIVEFVHSPRMYNHGIPVPVRHTIDLRAKLVERHGKHVVATGRSNRISICVHIRQGDCTWVKRGNRYVFLGMRKITSDPEDVDLRRAPPIDAYVPVLDALVGRLDGLSYDIKMFSDGPANIFLDGPSRSGRILYELARHDGRFIRWLRLNRRGNPLQAFYNPMCDGEVRQAYEQAKTGLQRLAARYQNCALVIGTSKALTADTILAFASADIVVLARSPGAFPLLGLGDPQNQAVLLLASPLTENRKRLEDFMANREVEE